MSPRRSSRARSSGNPPAPSQTASSTSSNTLKNSNTLRRSVSAEDILDQEDENNNEPIMPRRSRRNGVEDSRDVSQTAKLPNGLETTQVIEDDAEEVTRCICGDSEYPGPSANLRLARSEANLDAAKDMGDFFVQCDKCLVWQHGGCVGFQDEADLPDEYFCEICKPKLHKIYKEHNGRRSHYFTSRQPIKVVRNETATTTTTDKIVQEDASRSSSLSSGEPQKKSKKNNAMSESTKRRATMNSRGAYDEDEMLRRAIEESNRETGTLGKRTRGLDDESRQVLKRQRTGSMSSTSKRSTSPTETDNGPNKKSRQNLRATAAKGSREQEARDQAKEQQTQARAEAASKRHARSERRRGDDSPPPSPSISPSKGLVAKSKDRLDKGKSKPARVRGGVGSGGRRLGHNQYTRNRDADNDTPARDVDQTNGGSPPTTSNGINGESGRSSKAKTHPARTSLNEMKRRVAAILEFVGQMQTQSNRQTTKDANPHKRVNGTSNLKSENGITNNGDTGSGNETTGVATPAGALDAIPPGGVAGLVKAVMDAVKDNPAGSVGADTPSDATGSAAELSGLLAKPKFRDDAEFKDMGSTQMMEALTRELIAWQRVYGVYSR